MIDSYAHSQKEARVNGMLMNSADFSEAFQCKPGTNMNPNAKCQLWHLESEEWLKIATKAQLTTQQVCDQSIAIFTI